ncbi:MAG: hypothetical protein R2874_00950 [Desulfobacterales bacterium]
MINAAIYILEQIIDARRPGDADATATTFTRKASGPLKIPGAVVC